MEFTDDPQHKENIILKLTFHFAVDIVRYSEELNKKKRFVVAKQIIRSGTSIGANVKEAQNAESKLDFIHKMKIALKEADEIEYWLYLCKEIEPSEGCKLLLHKLIEIKKILTKIVATSKKKKIVT